MNKIDKKQMSKPTISRTKAVEMIMKTGGRFFTVTFNKANNEVRTINGRFKNQTKLGNLTVYSMKDKGYKSVNPKTILSLSVNSVVYTVK